MFYETTQTIGPGWHRSYKPTHYEDMTWSPSSKHFRTPADTPQSYRPINQQEDDDKYGGDEHFFSGGCSPPFQRKIFRDVWDEAPASNHRFADRPRLFKRVFKPSRWEDDDDFERTRSTVRQMAREFGPDFDTRNIDRDIRPDFDSRKIDRDFDFHHRDRNHKSDIEEEFEKAAGRVHHIPIMVERRLEEMRSRFGKNSPASDSQEASDEPDDWQGPQVQSLKKNFEKDEEFLPLHSRHRAPRAEINKTRAFTTPLSSRWDPQSVHTLPTRKSNKGSRIFEEPPPAPKSVFRSYSETHEDIPRQQQSHAAAFRSHSDGHCPKTTYVTKITLNKSPNTESTSSVSNGEIKEEHLGNQSYEDTSSDGWNSHQSRHKVSKGENADHGNARGDTEGNIIYNSDDDMKRSEGSRKNEEQSPKRSSLQQISAVLQNVDDLLVHVSAYSGTGRDKQYRFLDEMLTRCMLRLDDVDTEGKEDIRSARKAAVMKVQSCIEKLESKAEQSERQAESENSLQNGPEEKGVEESDLECKEAHQGASNDPPKEQVTEETTKQEHDEQTRL